jgi:DNA-binding transcriptional LysR family regulator
VATAPLSSAMVSVHCALSSETWNVVATLVMDTAQRELQDLTGLRRGRVRIGATPSLLTSLVAVALARFHQAFTRIELSVTQGGSRDLVGNLALGQLDLAVIVLPLQVGDPALETLPLLREELMVAAPSADPPQLRGGFV